MSSPIPESEPTSEKGPIPERESRRGSERRRSAVFEWPARGPRGGSGRTTERPLAERLAETAGDRVASAAVLLAESAERVWEWVREQPFDWSHADAARELERGLAAWSEAHAWRAPALRWLDALRRTVSWAARSGLDTPREALLEELAQWITSEEAPPGEGPRNVDERWNGEPLGEGRRLPRRAELCPWVLRGLERRECLLVHGYSETIAVVLEAAHEAGLEPQVLLTEGGPELGGKRLARRLAERCPSRGGISLRLGYDLAWMERLTSCDRVWVGTESIGAGAFTARVGTRLLFDEAHRREVPCEVLATSDKLSPGGGCELPSWGEDESWILWSDAPAGVTLERQPFEAVPLTLVDAFWTESGRETTRELFVRALPPEPVAPLLAPSGEAVFESAGDVRSREH